MKVGKLLSAEELNKIVWDSPIFGSKRQPNGPFDFGDAGTVGLRVKRTDKSFHELKIGQDFGVYLGEHTGMFIVGLIDIGGIIVAGRAYETLSELKVQCQLD